MPDKFKLELASKDHMTATVDHLTFSADNLLGDPMSACVALLTAASWFARQFSAEEREVVCRSFENGVKMFPPAEVGAGNAPN